MTSNAQDEQMTLEIAPYFDGLLARLEAGDPATEMAFGRHVHWGYWPEPESADGSAEDYAHAAERLCRVVCDAADLEDGMRILDVGCGIGGTIASLNERFSDLEMVGLNIDGRQLARAARTVQPKNGNHIQFVEGDATKLSFTDESFDAVLAVECIFHFDSRSSFFAGASRCLRPGGRIAISDFVPPQEQLETLRRHDPGNDPATRMTFGKIDVLCPIEEYQRMATLHGLQLRNSIDITGGTMPTYSFLRSRSREDSNRAAAKVHQRAVSRLEMACRYQLVQYLVLSFLRAGNPSSATD